MPGCAAPTINALFCQACQVRRCPPDAGWRCPGAAKRVAGQAAGMTGDKPAPQGPRNASAAQTGGGELIEVTFSPAEPQLAPGAARAVLAMLVRARERVGHAEG
jgi:hypothetical protein